jgi:hypothetical protein
MFTPDHSGDPRAVSQLFNDLREFAPTGALRENRGNSPHAALNHEITYSNRRHKPTTLGKTALQADERPNETAEANIAGNRVFIRGY